MKKQIENKFDIFGILFCVGILLIIIYAISIFMPRDGVLGLLRYLIDGVAFLAFGLVFGYITFNMGKSAVYNSNKKKYEFNIKGFLGYGLITIACVILTIASSYAGIYQIKNAALDIVKRELNVNNADNISFEVNSHARASKSYYMNIIDAEKKEYKQFEINKKLYNKLKNQGITIQRNVQILSYKNSDVIYKIS